MRAADCGGDQYPVVQEDMVRAYVYTVEFGSALNPRGDACILAMHACPPLLLLAQQVAFSLRPAPEKISSAPTPSYATVAIV
jgi:hypothetical protein